MDKWLGAALDYIPQWIDFQMRLAEQPGCTLAIAHQGKIVSEQACGHADLILGTELTPRHRFRVASHSKSFTAAGILKLREQGRLSLDHSVGLYVKDLHPDFAAATIMQLLSHTAGTVRDGRDSGQWQERRPFLNEAEIRADLAAGPTIAPNSRFKYSNHGYGLAGMVIEAVTGEPYRDWIAREIIAASGLSETLPDAPLPAGTPFARGHSGKMLLGRRCVIPGENSTYALASATGFVSTAADLARFFASLSPNAAQSVLSVASRREMTRRQWLDTPSSIQRWYGLGTVSGTLAGWDWFGHTGGFPGYITRTIVVPEHDLALSVLTNASDGMSHSLIDGMLHILRAYQRFGAPSKRTQAWSGRWWTLWGATDLLAMEDKVLIANPALANPVLDASEISVDETDRDGGGHGRITQAGGFLNFGEPARLVCNAKGDATEFHFGGGRLLREAEVARELTGRYKTQA